MKKYIGVFDSGIGGLTVLHEVKKILPNENYLYYADSKNNPYGEKNDEELYTIVRNVVCNLLKFDCKLIIIACNTATTKCIKRLREDFKDVIFVGTEPAIKVACDNNYNNTLVLATPGTIKSERVHELVEKNKKDNQNITLISCEGLANAIETNNKNKIQELLHNYLDEYKDKKIDAIVLGCTHYPHIKKNIQELFPNTKLIDGNKGIANRVNQLLKDNNLLSSSTTKGKTIIYKN